MRPGTGTQTDTQTRVTNGGGSNNSTKLISRYFNENLRHAYFSYDDGTSYFLAALLCLMSICDAVEQLTTATMWQASLKIKQ